MQSTADTGPLRVVQITDTHLYADPRGELLGLATEISLEQVVGMVEQQASPDLLLVTGDLVHDGSEAGYLRLRDWLDRFARPAYCLPGNHDDPVTLTRILNRGQVRTIPCATHGVWDFVFLDSTLASSEGGHLSHDELERLTTCLERGRAPNALVCLHHHPVPIDSQWLDTMAVDNAQAFFDLLDRFPQVRGVIWGHVHQAYDELRDGVRLLASPSTCIQFQPGSSSFGLDDATPGYRWLELHADGRIDTGIERLSTYPEGARLRSESY